MPSLPSIFKLLVVITVVAIWVSIEAPSVTPVPQMVATASVTSLLVLLSFWLDQRNTSGQLEMSMEVSIPSHIPEDPTRTAGYGTFPMDRDAEESARRHLRKP